MKVKEARAGEGGRDFGVPRSPHVSEGNEKGGVRRTSESGTVCRKVHPSQWKSSSLSHPLGVSTGLCYGQSLAEFDLKTDAVVDLG